MDCPTNTFSSPRTTTWQILKQGSWLGHALIVSILTLLLQIYGPPLMAWWQLPRPGRVGIDWLPQEFYEKKPGRTISPRYVCSLPRSYDEANTWPLVVFLHGSGQRGNDPQTLVPWGQTLVSSKFREFPAILLIPQCASERYWQTADVVGFVDMASHRYQIDRDRIYLLGHSMGGYGAWEAAAAYPDLFAAIVPMSGGEDSGNAQALAQIPIWAFHGAKDEVIPVEQTTALIEAIRAEGGGPKLTVFPKGGHRIREQVCERADLWQWLFEQNLSVRTRVVVERNPTEEHRD